MRKLLDSISSKIWIRGLGDQFSLARARRHKGQLASTLHLLLEANQERRCRMGPFPFLNLAIFSDQFILDLLPMIEIISHGCVDLGEGEVRVLPGDFFRRPTAPQVVRHDHGDPRAGVVLQPCRFSRLFHDLRIYQFDRHGLTVAGRAIPVNSALP
jgi:hypothetical protein